MLGIVLLSMLLIWIAWIDGVDRRIGNAPLIAVILTGIGVVAFNGLPWSLSLGNSLLAALLGLIGVLGFYAAGWMAAGDVKLMAALGVWLGAEKLFMVWCLATILALLHSIFYLVVRRYIVFLNNGWLDNGIRGLPFGSLLCVMCIALVWWDFFQSSR